MVKPNQTVKNTNENEERKKIDIIYLQETHLNDPEHQKTKLGYNKLYFSSFKGRHKRGVTILISSRITFEQSF